MISTATLRFVLYDHFNLLKQSFSIKLRSGIKINAKAKPRINGINVVKKEPKNLNITAQFLKIKYVITINIPEIVYALIFSFVCSFSSIFIFIMITHL